MTLHRILTPCLVAALIALPSAAPAQSADSSYLERYAEITRLTPEAGRVADVSRLVLTRDAGRLTMERGKLFLLSPVGGRTVAAVFQGEGSFLLVAPPGHEDAELRRFSGTTTSFDVPITQAVLIFSDSTMQQLRGLTFGPAEIPRAVQSSARDFVNSMKGEKEGSLDSDLMGPMLNGVPDGFFSVWMDRVTGDDILFQINPGDVESVQLYRPVSRVVWGTNWATVTQFTPLAADTADARNWMARDRVRTSSYRIDLTLSEAFSSNLGITASATIALTAAAPVGPWLLFRLHPKLDADSARWSSGERAGLFKADESSHLWVRAPRRLARGDSLSLTVFYHGDMIDRFGNFFYVDPLANWYPVSSFGQLNAHFDLTYHSPKRYPLVSIGERRDSSESGNVRTTRWVTRLPTPYASFNLGLFQPYHVQHPDAPPLDIYLSDEAHNLLRRQYAAMGYEMPEQRNMRETVAADVSNSLKLFTSLFGAPEYDRFSVSEIPYNEGVSFPGFIHLSWGTFQNTSLDGFDQFFRAHEVAHQWWGNAVRPGSYRDAWLSEGLATFSGIWYLQVLRRRDNEYNRFLEQYRADIDANSSAGPIALGYRLSSQRNPRGYQVLVYEKGAWVFHMLRSMMTDLGTMQSPRFTAMMREFYESNRGKTVTSDDFQRVVERHVGAPMGWFFEQWVRTAATPTYRVTWNAQPAEVPDRFRVHLRVTQEGVGPTFRMPVLVAADLGDDRTARFRVNVTGSQTEYVSPLLPNRPRSVTFNAMQSVLAEVRQGS